MWKWRGNIKHNEAKDALMCTTEMFCSIRAQFWEQVGVVWAPELSLEPSRGVMILIQQNICDGRCTCENPKDMAAFTSVPSLHHPHFYDWLSHQNSLRTRRTTTATVIINSDIWIICKTNIRQRDKNPELWILMKIKVEGEFLVSGMSSEVTKKEWWRTWETSRKTKSIFILNTLPISKPTYLT